MRREDSGRESDEDLPIDVPSGNRELTAPPTPSAPSPGLLNEVTGPMLLLILAVLYGGNVPLLKLIETTSPMSITGPELLSLRFLAAAVVLCPWAILNLGTVGKVLMPAMELSFYLWVGYTLQILGLESTSASVTSIVFASVGLIVQALEFAFDGKKPSIRVAGFSFGTLAGIAMFVQASGAQEDGKANRFIDILHSFFTGWLHKMPHETWLVNVPGEALAFGGAFFFAVHTWRCNKMVQERSARSDSTGDDENLALGISQCIMVAALCTAFSFWDSPYESAVKKVTVLERLGQSLWPQIAACGVVCTGLPSVLELFGFKVVQPAIAALIYCTMPLWGTMLGCVFLHESLAPQSIAAGIVILVCSLAPSVIEVWEQSGESPGRAAALAARTVPELEPPRAKAGYVEMGGPFEVVVVQDSSKENVAVQQLAADPAKEAQDLQPHSRPMREDAGSPEQAQNPQGMQAISLTEVS